MVSYDEPKETKDVNEWIAILMQKLLPNANDIELLCEKAKEQLLKEPNILEVPAPVTIVGDIHGQFYDLIEIFTVAGKVPFTSYLFMGDYVDRGYYSVETLLLLFALKIRYPTKVNLLRGNHETRQITQVYGFYDECLKKFGSARIWCLASDAFDCLPLAAVIGKGTSLARFAVHAGLTPLCDRFDDIAKLDRFSEVPHDGAMCDLLWSDPEDITGWGVSPRGAGFVFGADIVVQFNRMNGVKQVCRSHQLVMVGFKEMFEGNLVTVWSAPNYCYRCGNAGAVYEIDEDLQTNVSVFGPCPAQERVRPDQDKLIRPYPDYFL